LLPGTIWLTIDSARSSATAESPPKMPVRCARLSADHPAMAKGNTPTHTIARKMVAHAIIVEKTVRTLRVGPV
jgi:hypothetical protein